MGILLSLFLKSCFKCRFKKKKKSENIIRTSYIQFLPPFQINIQKYSLLCVRHVSNFLIYKPPLPTQQANSTFTRKLWTLLLFWNILIKFRQNPHTVQQ